MESGKDIDIKGSKAGGKKVEIKTGNNLSIESLQDSHTYHSRDKESGIHLQRDRITRPDTGKKKMDDPYFSIGKKTDTTDSTYISVTKQAGIYAGKEGYDIQVKNNTHLKGAVIDSQAEKEKKPDHHRYFDMGKHRKQSRIQNRRTRDILQRENRERRQERSLRLPDK